MEKEASLNQMNRRFIHLDMDAFFASVEQRDNPELLGIPIAVGGSPKDGGRGVVATASYEARQFGVRSAMSARTALRKCPNLTFVRPRFSRYVEVSNKVKQIVKQCAPQFEMHSIDECLIDVTELPDSCKSATEVAQIIRSRIASECGITASAGVSPLRFLSKIASDENKPNGITVIPPSKVSLFLETCPIKRIPGVGPKSQERFAKHGIVTCGDLLAKGEDWVLQNWGDSGVSLFRKCSGVDPRGLSGHHERKQVSAERTTFDNHVSSIEEAQDAFSYLAERVGNTLRKKGQLAYTLSIKARLTRFETKTVSMSPGVGVNGTQVLFTMAMELFESLQRKQPDYRFAKRDAGKSPLKGAQFRLLGLSASNLMPEVEGEKEPIDPGPFLW